MRAQGLGLRPRPTYRLGLPGGNRTPDLQLRRLLLYPTELPADVRDPFQETTSQTGRGGEIRTPDPLLPKQMRYQTALHPEKPAIIAGSTRPPSGYHEGYEPVARSILNQDLPVGRCK